MSWSSSDDVDDEGWPGHDEGEVPRNMRPRSADQLCLEGLEVSCDRPCPFYPQRPQKDLHSGTTHRCRWGNFTPDRWGTPACPVVP